MNNENQRNSKRKTSDPMNMGMLPPQQVGAEEQLLGCLLEYPGHITTIVDLFRPEVFYSPSHQQICQAMVALHQSNRSATAVPVLAELNRTVGSETIGGAFYLMSLVDKAINPSQIQQYIQLVYEAFLLREMITTFQHAVKECYHSADPFDVLTNVSRKLDVLQQGTVTKSEVHIKELAMDAIHDREKNPGVKENLGIPTGLSHLDKAIGGLQDEQLIIIGARPAMGKTAVALGIAKNVGLILKQPVALFSLEMSSKQLYTRFQAQVSGIDSSKIKYNNLSVTEKQILFKADGDLADSPIYMDDTPALNIDRFRAKATIMKHKYGIRAIIIDYLQLMKGSKGSFNKEAEVSEISGKLKQVAKELKIPIIALCQLNRSVESRAGSNKIPQLSDLRDSGSIEQDADTILFLYRPEYYGYTDTIPFTKYNVDLPTKDLLAFIIAKQREGETNNVPAMLKLSTMQLTDHPSLASEVPKQKPALQSGMMFGDYPTITPYPDQNEDAPF